MHLSRCWGPMNPWPYLLMICRFMSLSSAFAGELDESQEHAASLCIGIIKCRQRNCSLNLRIYCGAASARTESAQARGIPRPSTRFAPIPDFAPAARLRDAAMTGFSSQAVDCEDGIAGLALPCRVPAAALEEAGSDWNTGPHPTVDAGRDWRGPGWRNSSTWAVTPPSSGRLGPWRC